MPYQVHRDTGGLTLPLLVHARPEQYKLAPDPEDLPVHYRWRQEVPPYGGLYSSGYDRGDALEMDVVSSPPLFVSSPMIGLERGRGGFISARSGRTRLPSAMEEQPGHEHCVQDGWTRELTLPTSGSNRETVQQGGMHAPPVRTVVRWLSSQSDVSVHPPTMSRPCQLSPHPNRMSSSISAHAGQTITDEHLGNPATSPPARTDTPTPFIPDGDTEQHTHTIREERKHPAHQSATEPRPGTSTQAISFLSQPTSLSQLIRVPFRLRHQRVQFIQTLFDVLGIQHAAPL